MKHVRVYMDGFFLFQYYEQILYVELDVVGLWRFHPQPVRSVFVAVAPGQIWLFTFCFF